MCSNRQEYQRMFPTGLVLNMSQPNNPFVYFQPPSSFIPWWTYSRLLSMQESTKTVQAPAERPTSFRPILEDSSGNSTKNNVEAEPVKKQIKHHKKIIQRKEPRNVKVWKNSLLSFLSNKILKFISTRADSCEILKKMLQHLDINGRNAVDDYYTYAKKIVSRILNKVSIQKMRELWLGPYHNFKEDIKTDRQLLIHKYHTVIRSLSRHYLQTIATKYILISHKCKKHLRRHYLSMRRWLLLNLRDPCNFTDYRDFDL